DIRGYGARGIAGRVHKIKWRRFRCGQRHPAPRAGDKRSANAARQGGGDNQARATARARAKLDLSNRVWACCSWEWRNVSVVRLRPPAYPCRISEYFPAKSTRPISCCAQKRGPSAAINVDDEQSVVDLDRRRMLRIGFPACARVSQKA